jgi:hypothetical protein
MFFLLDISCCLSHSPISHKVKEEQGTKEKYIERNGLQIVIGNTYLSGLLSEWV